MEMRLSRDHHGDYPSPLHVELRFYSIKTNVVLVVVVFVFKMVSVAKYNREADLAVAKAVYKVCHVPLHERLRSLS